MVGNRLREERVKREKVLEMDDKRKQEQLRKADAKVRLLQLPRTPTRRTQHS